MYMNLDYLTYTLILFVLGVSLKMFFNSDAYNLTCVISNEDGNTYCVRERAKLRLVADLLARTTINMKRLVKHMEEKYPERDNVQRLVSKFNPKKIVEILPTSKYTAYSENKGEKIAFCVTKEKRNNDTLIDDNTLMFVALHELSHVATKSIGHTDEFWSNFKFLLQNAKEIDIYKPVDYKKDPERYCGMDITDNPYFDYHTKKATNKSS